MQRISLFEDDEEISRYLALGLNENYDREIRFSPKDLVLIGGRRGAGKSLTCANIAHNVFESGRSAMYFTIEMDSIQTLQRVCSIATGIPFSRLRTKNLSIQEWELVTGWFASRFENSNGIFEEYKEHRNFEDFHHKLTTTCGLLPTQQVDVIYDPALTLAKIKAEMDKKVKALDVAVVLVDYINQVKRSAIPSRMGQYDWTEQIEVSKALKSMAQEYECTVVTPYQTDAGGEARFAKGILDAADAAYALETYDQEDACMTFNCTKMRSAAMRSFTSTVNWETMKIGPDSAMTPKEREDSEHKTGEDIDDFRDEMPQLTEEILQKRDISYQRIEIRKTSIYPTQTDRLPFDDGKYMERYFKILNDAYKPLVIDRDGNLIDGHHRYDIMRRMDHLVWVRALLLDLGFYEVLNLFKNNS